MKFNSNSSPPLWWLARRSAALLLLRRRAPVVRRWTASAPSLPKLPLLLLGRLPPLRAGLQLLWPPSLLLLLRGQERGVRTAQETPAPAVTASVAKRGRLRPPLPSSVTAPWRACTQKPALAARHPLRMASVLLRLLRLLQRLLLLHPWRPAAGIVTGGVGPGRAPSPSTRRELLLLLLGWRLGVRTLLLLLLLLKGWLVPREPSAAATTASRAASPHTRTPVLHIAPSDAAASIHTRRGSSRWQRHQAAAAAWTPSQHLLLLLLLLLRWLSGEGQ